MSESFKLKEIKVTTHGDLIDLGVIARGVAIVVELTTEQAEELEEILRQARKDIASHA